MARERPTPTTGGHSHCLVCGAHLTEKSLTPAVNCYHGNTGKTLKARLEAALDIHLSPQDFHSEEICQSCEDILTDLEEYCQRRQNFTTTFWKTAERFQKQVKEPETDADEDTNVITEDHHNNEEYLQGQGQGEHKDPPNDPDLCGPNSEREKDEEGRGRPRTLRSSKPCRPILTQEKMTSSTEGKRSSQLGQMSSRGQQGYPCNRCGAVLRYKQSYIKHIASHSTCRQTALLRRCPLCDFTTGRRDYFMGHAECIHPDSQFFMCSHCPMVFLMAQSLQQHEDVHKPDVQRLQCHLCAIVVKRKDALVSHLKTHSSSAHTTKKCPLALCDFKSMRRSHYVSHLTKIHGDTQFEMCDRCCAAFLNNADLREHRRDFHFRLVCGVCGKRFDYPWALEKHSRVHTGERPHRCEQCQAAFTSQGGLNTHVRTVHSSDRPFLCSVCGKGFKMGTDLRKHQQRHLAVKLHVCSVCKKGFSLKPELRTHMKIHGPREHPCRQCAQTFAHPSNLRRHLGRVHRTLATQQTCSAAL